MIARKPRLLTLLVVTLCVISCRQQPMPVIQIGEVYWRDDREGSKQDDIRAVNEILKSVFQMIEQRNFSDLPKLISPEKGLYIDLKAHKTQQQLTEEIQKADGYFNKFFFDTQALREYTGNPERLALRDILHKSDEVKIDYYLEPGSAEIEAIMHLSDVPQYDPQFNHPVFILEDAQWKLYRLF